MSPPRRPAKARGDEVEAALLLAEVALEGTGGNADDLGLGTTAANDLGDAIAAAGVLAGHFAACTKVLCCDRNFRRVSGDD